MELLSNLVWMVVAIVLWIAWFAHRRRARTEFLRFGIAGQLVALCVLTLILLPVISVSDDLQASHNPAEVERACVRSDQHLLSPDAPSPTPAALVVVAACLLHACPRTIPFLRPAITPSLQQTGPIRALASRPPPVSGQSFS